MNAGLKGVQLVNPVRPTPRDKMMQRPERKDDVAPKEDEDVLLNISSHASTLNKMTPAKDVEEESPPEEEEKESLPLDSRKTAEAIMRKLVPELYKALLDAGEIEE